MTRQLYIDPAAVQQQNKLKIDHLAAAPVGENHPHALEEHGAGLAVVLTMDQQARLLEGSFGQWSTIHRLTPVRSFNQQSHLSKHVEQCRVNKRL